MTDDLRADALFLKVSPDKARPPTIRRVAAAMLELLPPADDTEIVTEEWLRSIGFVEYSRTEFSNPTVSAANLKLGRMTWRATGCTRSPNGGEPDWVRWFYFGKADVLDGNDSTRGDVRRLLEALGVAVV